MSSAGERVWGGNTSGQGVVSVSSSWRAAGRALATALLAGLVLLTGAAPAAAHNTLISSDPADGAAVATAPQAVRLTFDLPVQEMAATTTVTVTGPDGTRWERGPARVAGSKVTTGLGSLGPAGRYVVAFRVLSEDGHPVSGTVDFELTEPGSSPSPSPSSPSPAAPAAAGDQGARGGGGRSDMPVWPWLLGAVVLVGAGGAAALRVGRR
ncbi:MAG: copper resistance protein CopC [Pseudonocardiaceae bacterium]|nr:copper resistance protein CopC [Pseudonocardiaceae bacterium]